MQSMVGQLFNGLDAEALLAVPFFLLVGELMTSADVTRRMIVLAQAFVGHMRGGLAQVVTLFSMFFAGISGSSTADVAVLSRTVAPEMDREGYGRGFTAALIASASTIANLIPPSIMAVVYGATGNVSIAGLFLGGVVPGVLIGIGLMIYSYLFGPAGIRRRRATHARVRRRGARRRVAAGDSGDHHGRHPVRLVHADRGGARRGRLHRAGPDPGAPARPRPQPAARLHACGAALRDPHGGGRRRLGVRLDARLSARPRRGRRLDRRDRRHRSAHDHVPPGRAVRDRRRLRRRRAGDHHLHADHHPPGRARRASTRCTWA